MSLLSLIKPSLHKEQLKYEDIEVKTRSYK